MDEVESVASNPSQHVLETAGRILESDPWTVCNLAQRQAIINLLQASVDVMKSREALARSEQKREALRRGLVK